MNDLRLDDILHLTTRGEWQAAQEAGAYRADSLSREGFIHCSKREQILRVAEAYYAGRSGLVVLVVDPSRLTSVVRWEPGTDKPDELFPHVYGPIELGAVKEAVPLEPGPDGHFALPPALQFPETDESQT